MRGPERIAHIQLAESGFGGDTEAAIWQGRVLISVAQQESCVQAGAVSWPTSSISSPTFDWC